MPPHYFTHSASRILPILHFQFTAISYVILVLIVQPPHYFTHSAFCILPILHFQVPAITCALLVLIVLRLCVLLLKIMVEEISKTITQYPERLRRCSFAPRFSYGRRMLAEEGGPNAMFFTVLICDEPMALEFLKDIGLLRSKHFVQFLHLAPKKDWSQCDVPRWSSRAVYSDHIRLGLVLFCF